MAEKRKPTLVVLLRFPGKRGSYKVELFPASLWGMWFFSGGLRQRRRYRYRIRADGKWFNAPDGRPVCYTIHEVRDVVWRSLVPAMRKRR